jgi:hypothetical protein
MDEPTKVDSPEDNSVRTDSLKFEQVTIFYNFLFDVGDLVDPTKAARSLLKHDFALSAANFYNDDIEVAERFKDLLRLRKKAQVIDNFTKIL